MIFGTLALFSQSGQRRTNAAGNTPPTGRPDHSPLLDSAFTAGLCIVLAGCSAMTSDTSTAEDQGIQGKVHGGQQPVVGATVQLIAPGTTGYGSAGTVIASTTT